MAKILNIVKYPNKLLNTKLEPVKEINSEILELIEDMIATMYASKGIGLAANQVGVNARIAVVDIEWESNDKGEIINTNPLVLINPKITEQSEDKTAYNEGCLSLPGINEEISRPSNIVVEFTNKEGKTETISADGLLATCIQHEIDHLNGKMFIDYLSRLKKGFVLKKYKKLLNEE